MIISIKLVHQFMAIFFNFYTHIKSFSSTTSRAIHGLWWIKMTMVHSGLKGLKAAICFTAMTSHQIMYISL